MEEVSLLFAVSVEVIGGNGVRHELRLPRGWLCRCKSSPPGLRLFGNVGKSRLNGPQIPRAEEVVKELEDVGL